jgi:hypothetical protein
MHWRHLAEVLQQLAAALLGTPVRVVQTSHIQLLFLRSLQHQVEVALPEADHVTVVTVEKPGRLKEPLVEP